MDGILDIQTTNGSTPHEQITRDPLIIPYEFPAGSESFPIKEYTDPKILMSRIPDFRNTLHWDPLVATSPTREAIVHFFASDEPGEYIVTLVGISASGFHGEIQIPLQIISTSH